MKKLKGSFGAKLTACVLLCALVLVFIASFATMKYMENWGAYTGSYQSAYSEAVYGTARSVAETLAQTAVDDPDDSMGVPYESNVAITVKDGDKIVFDSYNGEKCDWTESFTVHSFQWERHITDNGAEEKEWILHEYQVTARLRSDMPYADEVYNAKELFTLAYSFRYAAIAVLLGSFILGVGFYVFLLSAAGHRNDREAVCGGFTEKIPYDLYTVLICVGIVICGLIIDENFRMSVVIIAIDILVLLAAGLLFLWWSMSTAVRVKLHTLWKNTVIWKVLHWVFELLGKCIRPLRELIGEAPLMPRGLIFTAVLLFADFIVFKMFDRDAEMLTFLWFVEKLALTALVVYALWCAVKLRDAARAIANGDMSAAVDISHMRGELRAHGEDINNIRGGISRAVEERMRSERFRTELITNVSHDIKTPLTSIINYVDLMEKEEPENEKTREYLEVIDRQSARLKKLIDDLMEASKASTGNLAVRLERCELGVLINQTVGEYQERLSDRGLELVTAKPDETVTVMADGRHMWRIFDNLMNNILKYAQSGTRVYLTLEKEGGDAVLIFRNISRARLELSGEELTERFVRGDVSRNSEGNGLGLSIAKSLAELQHGTLDIFVDGDLFKVVLRLPTAE